MSAAGFTGYCPLCDNDPDEILNVGRNHFAVCHECKVYWALGSNLFSGWRNEEPEIWERNKKLLASYRTASEAIESAMCNGPSNIHPDTPTKTKPKVKVSTVEKRPTIRTLGDVLKATADREPKGCTLINGYSESRWNGLRQGEGELLELTIQAATACLEPTNAVTVYISEGTTPATARALLKAIAKEIKGYDNFERFTPLVPVSADSLPF